MRFLLNHRDMASGTPLAAVNRPGGSARKGCRLLIVEDDPDIARLIELHLADLQCEIVSATDGLAGFRLAQESRFDLVILDLGLPSLDGLEVCRRLRLQPYYTPILILTARAAETDRVRGFETGGDDYLTKPFSVRELVARVRAVLRRGDALAAHAARCLRFGALLIDVPARSATLGEKVIELTAREFDLLLQFATHPGRVFTRTQLLDQVWGYTHSGYEHTVNTHINRLRAKIELDPSNPQYILTSWGVGYRFTERQDPHDRTSNA